MNIATMTFVTSANDVLTELLNDHKNKEYKHYYFEIGEHLSNINKKVNRIYKSKYNDVICTISDKINLHINQLDNYFKRKLITSVEYQQIGLYSKTIILSIFIDYADALYAKNQKDNNTFKINFEELVKANNRYLDMFNLLDDEKYNLWYKDIHSILDNMCICVRDGILNYKKDLTIINKTVSK